MRYALTMCAKVKEIDGKNHQPLNKGYLILNGWNDLTWLGVSYWVLFLQESVYNKPPLVKRANVWIYNFLERSCPWLSPCEGRSVRCRTTMDRTKSDVTDPTHLSAYSFIKGNSSPSFVLLLLYLLYKCVTSLTYISFLEESALSYSIRPVPKRLVDTLWDFE